MVSAEPTPKLTVHNSEQRFARIDAFFDAVEHVVERSEGAVWKSKRLIFGVVFALFLLYELAHFAKFLLKNWSG